MPHDEDDAPLPSTRRDPYADANDALRRAAEARGVEAVPLTTPKPGQREHPMAAAHRALADAAAAREEAKKGKLGLAREAEARAQLDALRRGQPYDPLEDADTEENEPADGPPTPSRPKKRTL